MKNDQVIQLANPVSEHFATFIFGNATMCEKVVTQNSAEGEHIVICGAGPSLAEEIDAFGDANQVWGCNSAMTWLADNGHPVTHGFTIDQTPQMCEEWYKPPKGVKFLLASSVHPHLTEYLLSENRDLTFFHNFVALEGDPVHYGVCHACEKTVEADEPCPVCGAEVESRWMSYEDWIYTSLYPLTVRVGAGLNSVSRAIDVAMFMGAAKVSVLGADCALRVKSRPHGPFGSSEYRHWIEHDTVMHADGSNALRSGATAQTLEAEIDGRYWVTKPDMAITAVFLVQMKRYYGDRLELVGDTLPNWIVDKDDTWLEQLPSLTDGKGNILKFMPPEESALTSP